MQRHSMQEVIKAWFYYFMHGLGACLACYVRDGVQGGSSKQSQGKVTKKKKKSAITSRPTTLWMLFNLVAYVHLIFYKIFKRAPFLDVSLVLCVCV